MRNIYKCRVCGAYTEDPVHCGKPCRLLLDGRRRLMLSKLMSFILRHCPECVGLELDKEGFVSVRDLAEAIRERWVRKELYSFVTEEHIVAIAKLDPKGRFELKGDRIRAAYGHTVKLELEYSENVCGKVKELYHGTTEDVLENILKEGLKPMKRLYVHMTDSIEDAVETAKRKGRDVVVLVIDVDCVCRAGIQVFKAGRTVYVAKYVPPQCIKRVLRFHAQNFKKQIRN